ncbi:MAG: GTPase, partial [Nanoarchaeota archaeon]
MQQQELAKEERKDPTREKIKELDDLISKTKYNKSTQHAIGLYKAQLAKLKEKQKARSGGRKGEGYNVRKTGDGTVVLLGFPSVGKSTLLNALTNANSAVAAYAFTTLTVIPGILEYKHAKIQVLDVPGVMHGAAAGTGRGK